MRPAGAASRRLDRRRQIRPASRDDHRPVAATWPARAELAAGTATAVGAVAETLREQGLPSPEGKIDFMAARTANEVLKARLRRMELQQKGELVDRARATALVFRLARQERDVWLGWPARIAALMAAELGLSAHALQTVLESHVREHLASLAEVRPEFR